MYDMHPTVRELIKDRRAVANYPINSAGLPDELIRQMEDRCSSGANFDDLHREFSDTIDALIKQGC